MDFDSFGDLYCLVFWFEVDGHLSGIYKFNTWCRAQVSVNRH